MKGNFSVTNSEEHSTELSDYDNSEQQHSAVAESRLVEAARQGDRDSFGELVLRYERRLYQVVYRFVRDTELAFDLTQETFLRAFERLEQFDPSRRFGPWLFQIGVNLSVDFLRKKKRRGWASLFTDAPSERMPDPGTDDPRHQLDVKQEVWAVLEQIPEKYRQVLILRDLENFSNAEIAAIMNRKEATIRWRLAEARDRFHRLWVKRVETAENTKLSNSPSLSAEASPDAAADS